MIRNELATQARRPGSAVFHLILLGCYLVAGVAVSWPRASYLAGRLPATVDQGGYVWSFWWVAHQIAHLGNPWFTRRLAAPVGMQLGFDTLMPLLGAVMAPVTGVFGPSASYNLLAIVIPGLLCYAAYRAARLWLPSRLGAIAAGAFYGLATMLVWEDWYHINIAAGALLLPAAVGRPAGTPCGCGWAGRSCGSGRRWCTATSGRSASGTTTGPAGPTSTG